MKRFLSIFFVSLLISCTVFASQITVVKQANYSNPSLVFKGITGDQQFSNDMLSTLKYCDWFNVSSTGTGSYAVSGSVSGGKATVTVSGQKNFSVSLRIEGSTRWTSYKVVDAILKEIFGVNGMCTSKLSFVAKVGNAKNVWISNFDGSDATQLTNDPTLALEPSWGLNNRVVVYTRYLHGYTDVVAVDVHTKNSVVLTRFPGLNTGGVISPNGQYLAVILSKDKKVALYVKPINAPGIRRITNSLNGVDGCPTWDPSGKEICFVSNMVAERPTLYICNFATNKISPVQVSGSQAVSPSWSPDGKKIVYSAKVGNYTLAVYDVATGTSSVVDNMPGGDWFSPSWAPDNRHVIASRRVDYFYQLYMVDTWTGKCIRICPSKYNLSSPDWSSLYK